MGGMGSHRFRNGTFGVVAVTMWGMPVSDSVLSRFSRSTRAWFETSFQEPTAAQAGAWEAIAQGDHSLVVAPTGSGKTLSAFLWAIDGLMFPSAPSAESAGDGDRQRGVSVVYISPLKALASDVERNLSSPLVGIGHAADRLGLDAADVSVALRTGDTPANERRAMAKNPPDILVTTPESLFLMLTSAVREVLGSVTTVIVDEIHSLAGTKRGAHLALSLERLDALVTAAGGVPVQRVGLSATVHEPELVAGFLAGSRAPDEPGFRKATVTSPGSQKQWDLSIVVPCEDMSRLGEVSPTDVAALTGPAASPPKVASMWPYIETDVLERISPVARPGMSSLVFTNARRQAERLTSRLNERWHEMVEAGTTSEAGDRPTLDDPAAMTAADIGALANQLNDAQPAEPTTPPTLFTDAPATDPDGPRLAARHMAEAMGTHSVTPAPHPGTDIVRAHHGSVSKERRRDIEEALKAGNLPAVVATSSLELGIDMGAIDQVLLISPPPSVAAGLQRVGRAGHQVGAVSTGVLYPKHRSELVLSAIITERMASGDLEPLTIPANPLDVLAQHLVAMVSDAPLPVDDVLALVRRATPFAELPRSVFDAVLDMVSGNYPSTDFSTLAPRVVYDRTAGTLTARPGARRVAVTNAGTIPDRGLFGVFLAGAEGASRRVGELDEEMVYESRVGDVFTLGTSTWRIEDITFDQVLVTPAPGEPARLPFWRGENPYRPVTLGRALGEFYRFVEESGGPESSPVADRLRAAGMDERGVENTCAYLAEQVEACGHLPTDRRIVVESFQDQLGDWRVAIHSPLGQAVHQPWALVLGAHLSEVLGFDVAAMAHDDGIVLRLPDMGSDEDPLDQLLAHLALDTDTIRQDVTNALGGSSLFASRFRECAARALLLPRKNPGARQPLWQQRQRAAALLEVVARYPSFPMVLETVRECLVDVFDVPALQDVLGQLATGRLQVVTARTSGASPFASSLMFGYVSHFLYEGDSPLAEKRAAALSLDPELLADLLGLSDGITLADLLDDGAVAAVEQRVSRRGDDYAMATAENLADALRILGPLTLGEVTARWQSADQDAANEAWQQLIDARRAMTFTRPGATFLTAIEDAGMLRDALGVPLPQGVPAAFTGPTEAPLASLLTRHLATHAFVRAGDVAARFGIGIAVAKDALDALVSAKKAVSGRLDPRTSDHETDDYADADVMRRMRRASLAALRKEVEPVPTEALASFLPTWQGVGQLRGMDGVYAAIESLDGLPVPASALESFILPARVRDYAPSMLDGLLASGDVVWLGHGPLPRSDGWVSLSPRESLLEVPRVVKNPDHTEDTLSDAARTMLDVFAGGGSHYLTDVATKLGMLPRAAGDALWELIWAGLVSGDTFAPVRAMLSASTTSKTAPRAPTRARYPSRRRSLRAARAASVPRSDVPATASGRFAVLPSAEVSSLAALEAQVELLLDRYGVLTRGAVQSEDVPGGYAAVMKVLAAHEMTGQVRRGYFVESLGASQFATSVVVDRLRAVATERDEPGRRVPRPVVLAATDPANPFGSLLPWPECVDVEGQPVEGRSPARRGSAVVVTCDGTAWAHVDVSAKTLTLFADGVSRLDEVASTLADVVQSKRLSSLTLTQCSGMPMLEASPQVLAAFEAAGFHATPKGLRIR